MDRSFLTRSVARRMPARTFAWRNSWRPCSRQWRQAVAVWGWTLQRPFPFKALDGTKPSYPPRPEDCNSFRRIPSYTLATLRWMRFRRRWRARRWAVARTLYAFGRQPLHNRKGACSNPSTTRGIIAKVGCETLGQETRLTQGGAGETITATRRNYATNT